MNSVEEMKNFIRQFASKRGWNNESVKNLSMALCVEASELLEIFQWLSEKDANNLNDIQMENVSDELIDILAYLIRIADILNIDLTKAFHKKFEKNAKKYPCCSE